jgi:hypothetical protein
MRHHFLAGIAFLFSTSALAADIPTDLQVELQSAMLSYIDDIVVDGAYTYVDTKEQAVKTVYPANIHPIIVPFGSDYFVCSEMVDANGNKLTADFLVRLIEGDYRVVQMIMANREALEVAMSKLDQ